MQPADVATSPAGARTATPAGRALARAPGGLWGDLAAVTVLAAVLRLHRLNEQLWLDEIAATIHSFRRTFTSIVTEPAGFVSHPLYELLASASLHTFGEQPWTVRLPAVVFGIFSVPLLYVLVRRLAGRGEALLAAGLLAVSAHHVFFSQNARGYTVMLFFLLAATLVLLRLPDGLSKRSAAIYAGLAALGAYALPFGVGIGAGHGLVALTASLVWRRHRQAPSPGLIVLLFAVTGGVIALLYAPLITHTVGFAASESGAAAPGLLVLELWRNLQAALGGSVGVLAAAVVALAGAADYARRQPFALGLLAAPVVVTAVVLVGLQVQIHPRYLVVAFPAGIVVAARGLTVLWRLVAKRIPHRLRTATAGVSLMLVVGLAASVGLLPYFAAPRQDFLGALDLVDRLAQPGDEVVAVSVAGHAIDEYYRPGFPTVQVLDDLRRIEADAEGGVLVITTLERVVGHHQGALLEHLRTQYELVDVLPGTIDDADMRVYRRAAPSP